MAKVVITIEDFIDGEIAVEVISDPLAEEDSDKWMLAQNVAYECVQTIHQISTSHYEVGKDNAAN